MSIRKLAIYGVFALATTLTTAAQEPQTHLLLCKTTDGDIRITKTSISIRDYRFQIGRVLSQGVIQLEDCDRHAMAVLDTRDPDGMYLIITERGIRMLVVAPRTGMTVVGLTEDNDSSSPAASVNAENNLISFSYSFPR